MIKYTERKIMKKHLFIAISLFTILLTSCEIVLPSVPFVSSDGSTTGTTDTTSFTETTSSSETTSNITTTSSATISSSNVTSNISNNSNSSSGTDNQPVGYIKNNSPTINLNQYRQASGFTGLPTSGDVKLLVIPVTFTDYRCGSDCATRKEQIQKSFFGQASETSWHSVKSYYEASSYGALTLTGVVTDWFDSSWSSSEFAELTTNEGDYFRAFDPTWAMLNAAVSWYKTSSGSNLTEYDTDQDGFIDSVYLVYNNPNSSNANYPGKGDDIYWAYAYWNYNNYGFQSVSSPIGMTYLWSSYDFMHEGYGVNGIDAHTYIHELGHAFGLDDYYTYTDGDWDAAGGLDMMDRNILDHNAFSKYLLGWANPFVLNSNQTTTTVVLKPFESSGEFFLLGTNWNGSAFDNYLIFEFYTPTGLNFKDSQAAYPGNNVRGFNVSGVKIYHVDARLGRFSNSTGNFLGYTDTVNNSGSYPMIAHSNSLEYTENEDYKLIHLIEKNGVNTFIDGKIANNNTLFRQGDTFNPTTTHASFFHHQTGRFNDESLIGYQVNVTTLTNQAVTLTVTKI
jgi:M6 family metalloprotease-like protein